MEKQKSDVGRPEASNLPSDLIDAIKKYTFPHSPFSQNKTRYSLSQQFRGVARIVNDKLQSFLSQDPFNYQVRTAVKAKLQREEEFNDFIKGTYPSDILDAKTLQRSFKEGKSSKTTIEILNAFKYIIEDEAKTKQNGLHPIAGLYLEYNVHKTPADTFQESLLWIKEDGTAISKYIDSQYHEVEHTLEAENINKSGLLLTHKTADFALLFYLYISGTHHNNKPYPFLQGVHIYPDRTGNIISALSVFHKLKLSSEQQEREFFEGFTPRRELKEINPSSNYFMGTYLQEKAAYTLHDLDKKVEKDISLTVQQNIQYFLLRRAKPISTLPFHGRIPFDFSKNVDAYPGVYSHSAHSYNTTRRLIGKYDLYFNEYFPSCDPGVPISNRTPFFSNVGIGILMIELDKQNGEFICQMEVSKDCQVEPTESIIYKGAVINNRLTTNEYLILSLYQKPEEDRYANLVFKIVDHKKLTGCYNITYLPAGELGSGSLFALKREEMRKKQDNEFWNQKELQEERLSSESLLPYPIESGTGLKRQLENYFTRRKHSLISPPNLQDLEKYNDSRYKGVYFQYYRSRKGKINVALLIIYANGNALYLKRDNNQQGDERKILNYGIVEQQENRPILNIIFNNREKNLNRTLFFIIRVNNEKPTSNQTFYEGIYSGVNRITEKSPIEYPIASSFILEFASENPPTIFSQKEYEILQKKRVGMNDSTSLNELDEWFSKLKDVDYFQGKKQKVEREFFSHHEKATVISLEKKESQ